MKKWKAGQLGRSSHQNQFHTHIFFTFRGRHRRWIRWVGWWGVRTRWWIQLCRYAGHQIRNQLLIVHMRWTMRTLAAKNGAKNENIENPLLATATLNDLHRTIAGFNVRWVLEIGRFLCRWFTFFVSRRGRCWTGRLCCRRPRQMRTYDALLPNAFAEKTLQFDRFAQLILIFDFVVIVLGQHFGNRFKWKWFAVGVGHQHISGRIAHFHAASHNFDDGRWMWFRSIQQRIEYRPLLQRFLGNCVRRTIKFAGQCSRQTERRQNHGMLIVVAAQGGLLQMLMRQLTHIRMNAQIHRRAHRTFAVHEESKWERNVMWSVTRRRATKIRFLCSIFIYSAKNARSSGRNV